MSRVNEAGVVVGFARRLETGVKSGMMFDKGAITLFPHPGSSFAIARAIGKKGLVTGSADPADGKIVGFLYDPATVQLVEFLPSGFTMPKGINERGETSAVQTSVPMRRTRGLPRALTASCAARAGKLRYSG